MLPHGAFTALLLLVSGLSAEAVPPPTNVTVNCQNLQTTVSWDYSEHQPQTSFRVHIKGSAGEEESETTERHSSLNHFVWRSEERYMAFLYVTVTAVQGGELSEAAQSNSFSFNSLKTVDTKCVLEFPPVDVTEAAAGATVSFQNPFHFYKELKQANKPDDASFTFTASTVGNGSTPGGAFKGSCRPKQDTCKLNVSFPEGVGRCVTLEGMLFDRMGIYQVMLKETEQICAPASTNVHVLVAAILGSAFVLIIIVVVSMICISKAWTMEIPKPKDLLTNHRELDLRYRPVSMPDISIVSIVKPQKSLSVSSVDDYPKMLQDGSASDDRYSLGRSAYKEGRLSDSSDEELEPEGSICDRNGTDDDSAGDSMKTECVTIDSEEEDNKSVLGYDRPHHNPLPDCQKLTELF